MRQADKKGVHNLHPWYPDVRIFTIEDFAESDSVKTILAYYFKKDVRYNFLNII
jgi:hypothetical protein